MQKGYIKPFPHSSLQAMLALGWACSIRFLRFLQVAGSAIVTFCNLFPRNRWQVAAQNNRYDEIKALVSRHLTTFLRICKATTFFILVLGSSKP